MQNFLDLIIDPLKEIYVEFAKFLPNLLAMVVIFIIGIIAARVVKVVLLKVLKAVNYDTWSDRMGFTTLMRKGDMWAKPSAAVVAFFFWLLIAIAGMAGLSALKIQAIDQLISEVVRYVPRALSAVLIVVIGYIVTGFVGRAVLISTVNKGYHFAKLLAEAVRLLLIVLFVAMALEQLQVAPGIVVSAFSIIFGGIVLALAIAFGVGGIDAAKKIIEHRVEKKKEENKNDIEHL
jgi:hypothetical protein